MRKTDNGQLPAEAVERLRVRSAELWVRLGLAALFGVAAVFAPGGEVLRGAFLVTAGACVRVDLTPAIRAFRDKNGGEA
jgi:hypothetical protein